MMNLESWFAQHRKKLTTLLALLFLVHFAVILRYAVNVPLMDEWEAFSPARRYNLSSPIFSYLTYHHLETRLFFTHLQEYIALQLNGLDNRFYVAFSFMVYGVLLVMHSRIQKSIREDVPFFIQFFSLLPLLTPYFWEAHAWGQQSHIHYSMIATLLFVMNGFKTAPTWQNRVLSLVFLLAMVFSFSRGASSGLVLTLLFVVHELRYRRYPWALGLTAWAALVYLWHFGFFNLEKPLGAHLGAIYPTDFRFWDFFINLGSRVFGFHYLSLPLGLVSFGILGFTVLSLFRNRDYRLTELREGDWQLLAIFAAWIGAMGATSLGRAVTGIESSQLSRYAFANGQLLPYVLLTLWMTQDGRRLTRWAFTFTLLFAFAGFGRSVTKSSYKATAKDKKKGLLCIQEQREEIGHKPIICPEIYPGDIEPMLQTAERLNLSFLRDAPGHPHKGQGN